MTEDTISFQLSKTSRIIVINYIGDRYIGSYMEMEGKSDCCYC